MVSALDRKLLRDLWRTRGPSLAIALVVACAVATFVGTMSTQAALQRTQASYYLAQQFGHVFAQCSRAPEGLLSRIREIPGVGQTESRIVADVRIEVPGFGEPATARLLSLPANGRPLLNQPYLRAGRDPAPGANQEALVIEGFALAHGLRPGDSVAAIINGRRQELRIVGIALAPDYVYAIRPGDMLPDDRHFGVFWMAHDGLAAPLDMKGAFNEISLQLGPGASEPEVISRLDALLARYGGLGAYGRGQQVSHRFVSDELKQLQSMAAAGAIIFLGVASFLLSVVLSRLVATQRQQIGTLKALGYSNWAVAAHFAKLIAVVVLAGAALGAAGGWGLGSVLSRMYADFYRFPQLLYKGQLELVAIATGLSLAAAFAGTAGPISHAVKLAPAEAMRPEPPADYKATLLERLGLARLLGAPGRMVLRNLGRRPMRAGLTAFGISAAVAILVVSGFFKDAMGHLADFQFERVQREDATVTFAQPLTSQATDELGRIPGVLTQEPFRAVSAVLRAGHRSYRSAIMGYAPGASLHRIADSKGRFIAPPYDGLVLSSQLAKILGVAPGDKVQVEVLEGRRPVRDLLVAHTIDDMFGVSATMSIENLNRLMEEGALTSGAFLSLDPAVKQSLYEKIHGYPQVTGMTLRSTQIDAFREAMSKQIDLLAGLLLMFAVLIACGVVYNAARVSLAERERELATLRVIGFTIRETWQVVLGELGALTLAALPVGWVLGWGLSAVSAYGLSSDLFRIPVVLLPRSYASAAMVVVGAAAAVAVLVRRWIARFVLVEVLKARE